MFLDIALDLVLDQVGRDGMEHRAEDEVTDAGRPRCVHESEAHSALGGMNGWSDMVNASDAVHCSGDDGWLGEVAHHHLLHAKASKVISRRLALHASAHALTCCKQLWDQPLALVAVGGRDEDHVVAFQSELPAQSDGVLVVSRPQPV